MKRVVKRLLKKAPFFRGIIDNLEDQGRYPAGHYYSPIPSKEDVRAYLGARKPPPKALAGIQMNEASQHLLLSEYAQFYKDVSFSKEQGPSQRYYYGNVWFGYSDAFFLYCFLRKHQPRRIVEIGSGFSSAVMLDTIDAIPSRSPEITFIEPHPWRLDSLLRDGDRQKVRVLDRKIQEVPPEVFSVLESGDLLFVDSSHVVKCGSDLQLLMFEVLPHLAPGVVVHFHDVLYPFDYIAAWLLEGRYWNESYFLRAFLSYNSEWSILFFNNYLHYMFGDVFRATMPLWDGNPGGSLYIQRNESGID